jgi:hypothetical protein
VKDWRCRLGVHDLGFELFVSPIEMDQEIFIPMILCLRCGLRLSEMKGLFTSKRTSLPSLWVSFAFVTVLYVWFGDLVQGQSDWLFGVLLLLYFLNANMFFRVLQRRRKRRQTLPMDILRLEVYWEDKGLDPDDLKDFREL